MSFDLKSIRKSEAIAAPRVMLYGVEGENNSYREQQLKSHITQYLS